MLMVVTIDDFTRLMNNCKGKSADEVCTLLSPYDKTDIEIFAVTFRLDIHSTRKQVAKAMSDYANSIVAQ